MDTLVTRVWKGNVNNFVISDCPEKHAAAVAGMVANGGVKFESNVAKHGLGEVFIIRNRQDDKESSFFVRNTTRSLLQSAHKILRRYELLDNAGVEVKALDVAASELIEHVFNFNHLDKRDVESRKIIDRYLYEDAVNLDQTVSDFFQYLSASVDPAASGQEAVTS
jgi:hypothetical protein